jgi:hypothetical protein
MENKKYDNFNKKMHPAFTNQQKEVDEDSKNPIDISNAPDDADHDENFGLSGNKDKKNKKKYIIFVNKNKNI